MIGKTNSVPALALVPLVSWRQPGLNYSFPRAFGLLISMLLGPSLSPDPSSCPSENIPVSDSSSNYMAADGQLL